MEYTQLNNKFIIRLDTGEEIVETLLRFCAEQKIKLGWISGIGATNEVKIGLFHTKNKKYYSKKLKGDYEITSLLGNISTMKEKIYLHLHINLCDKTYRCFGGHLDSAIISGTFEGIIQKIEGRLKRKFNQKVGLNLLKF